METIVEKTRPENKNSSPLPYCGRWHYAKEVKYKETILFVHFFGGSPLALKRHIELVNEVGFNAVTFKLDFNEIKLSMDLPISSKFKLGAFSVWQDQIEAMLNAVIGPKLIYAFSNPGYSALAAISERKATDVTAIICDSGPTYHIWKSCWNLLGSKYKIKNPILRLSATPLGIFFTGKVNFRKNVSQVLKNIPVNFPVLSIRGWQDKLISFTDIEAFFAQQSHLNLKVLALPEAGHVDGLKYYADEYIPPVKNFLEIHGTKLK